MPLIIEELIAILIEAMGEEEVAAGAAKAGGAASKSKSASKGILKSFESFGKKFMGNKFPKAKKAIKKLNAAQNEEFKSRIGEKLHKHIEKHLNVDNSSSIRVDTPNSSWVQYLEWDKKTQLGTLKTKKSPKIYKLPFFPRSIIVLVQRGASAGKTLWRKYWRVFGKGNKANKKANYKRIQIAKKQVKNINLRRGYNLNIKTRKIERARKAYIRTGNIKNTSAMGVKITIVKPKKPGKNRFKII